MKTITRSQLRDLQSERFIGACHAAALKLRTVAMTDEQREEFHRETEGKIATEFRVSIFDVQTEIAQQFASMI